jgi:hypothetical protein
MKRKIGTVVLFVLLLLTVVALKHTNVPQATIGSAGEVKRTVN